MVKLNCNWIKKIIDPRFDSMVFSGKKHQSTSKNISNHKSQSLCDIEPIFSL